MTRRLIYRFGVVVTQPVLGLLRMLVLALATMLGTASAVKSQPREGRLIDIAAGLGLSAPYDDSYVSGEGVFMRGEYVFGLSRWFGFRPSVGLLLTWPDENDSRCTAAEIDCEVTAKIALLGGKVRLAAPIPWVAPFLEFGVGTSLGVIKTLTPGDDARTAGVALHIPSTLGLALGADHAVEVALVYYFHPAENQFGGAVAIGLSFPIDRSERPDGR